MQMPKILTVVIEKNSNFTLEVYAYRPLTGTEKRQALLQWLQASKKKRFPKNGRAKLITLFGINPQDEP